jgi:hypothetical protein
MPARSFFNLTLLATLGSETAGVAHGHRQAGEIRTLAEQGFHKGIRFLGIDVVNLIHGVGDVLEGFVGRHGFGLPVFEGNFGDIGELFRQRQQGFFTRADRKELLQRRSRIEFHLHRGRSQHLGLHRRPIRRLDGRERFGMTNGNAQLADAPGRDPDRQRPALTGI